VSARDNIAVPRDPIAAFCRRHHIAKLAFLGSVLREDFSPKSREQVLAEAEVQYVGR
jgi:predicted nucleotidyltransferase